MKKTEVRTTLNQAALYYSRRLLMVLVFLLLNSCALARQESEVGGQDGQETMSLTVYSPAPPSNILHTLNLDLLDAANQCRGLPQLTVVPVALPDSINSINKKSPAIAKTHLPIVTTVDLLPAREKTGVYWHTYKRANRDLKLVTVLYDIGFGLLSFDPAVSAPSDLKGKKIGVPPRPSSIRVLSEALLRDGWGILEDVELVDLTPPQVEEALVSGRIEATTWNLVRREHDGFSTLLPNLLKHPHAHWIEVNEGVIVSINENNPFVLSMTTMDAQITNAAGDEDNSVNLLSFAQALAAWDSTDKKIIEDLLDCIVNLSGRYNGLPSDIEAMLDWPALTEELLHPAAVKFYGKHGLDIERTKHLHIPN